MEVASDSNPNGYRGQISGATADDDHSSLPQLNINTQSSARDHASHRSNYSARGSSDDGSSTSGDTESDDGFSSGDEKGNPKCCKCLRGFDFSTVNPFEFSPDFDAESVFAAQRFRRVAKTLSDQGLSDDVVVSLMSRMKHRLRGRAVVSQSKIGASSPSHSPPFNDESFDPHRDSSPLRNIDHSLNSRSQWKSATGSPGTGDCNVTVATSQDASRRRDRQHYAAMLDKATSECEAEMNATGTLERTWFGLFFQDTDVGEQYRLFSVRTVMPLTVSIIYNAGNLLMGPTKTLTGRLLPIRYGWSVATVVVLVADMCLHFVFVPATKRIAFMRMLLSYAMAVCGIGITSWYLYYINLYCQEEMVDPISYLDGRHPLDEPDAPLDCVRQLDPISITGPTMALLALCMHPIPTFLFCVLHVFVTMIPRVIVHTPAEKQENWRLIFAKVIIYAALVFCAVVQSYFRNRQWQGAFEETVNVRRKQDQAAKDNDEIEGLICTLVPTAVLPRLMALGSNTTTAHARPTSEMSTHPTTLQKGLTKGLTTGPSGPEYEGKAGQSGGLIGHVMDKGNNEDDDDTVDGASQTDTSRSTSTLRSQSANLPLSASAVSTVPPERSRGARFPSIHDDLTFDEDARYTAESNSVVTDSFMSTKTQSPRPMNAGQTAPRRATARADETIHHQFDEQNLAELGAAPSHPTSAVSGLALERMFSSLEYDKSVDRARCATVLFADMKGFTQWSATRTARDVATMLNTVVAEIDSLAYQHDGVEKIKTIGDAYWAVTGLPEEFPGHADVMLRFAFDMTRCIDELNVVHPEWDGIHWRTAVHSGPLSGAILGTRQTSYEVFGRTLMVCQKVEAAGIPGQVCCSDSTLEALCEDSPLKAFMQRFDTPKAAVQSLVDEQCGSSTDTPRDGQSSSRPVSGRKAPNAGCGYIASTQFSTSDPTHNSGALQLPSAFAPELEDHTVEFVEFCALEPSQTKLYSPLSADVSPEGHGDPVMSALVSSEGNAVAVQKVMKRKVLVQRTTVPVFTFVPTDLQRRTESISRPQSQSQSLSRRDSLTSDLRSVTRAGGADGQNVESATHVQLSPGRNSRSRTANATEQCSTLPGVHSARCKQPEEKEPTSSCAEAESTSVSTNASLLNSAQAHSPMSMPGSGSAQVGAGLPGFVPEVAVSPDGTPPRGGAAPRCSGAEQPPLPPLPNVTDDRLESDIEAHVASTSARAIGSARTSVRHSGEASAVPCSSRHRRSDSSQQDRNKNFPAGVALHRTSVSMESKPSPSSTSRVSAESSELPSEPPLTRRQGAHSSFRHGGAKQADLLLGRRISKSGSQSARKGSTSSRGLKSRMVHAVDVDSDSDSRNGSKYRSHRRGLGKKASSSSSAKQTKADRKKEMEEKQRAVKDFIRQRVAVHKATLAPPRRAKVAKPGVSMSKAQPTDSIASAKTAAPSDDCDTDNNNNTNNKAKNSNNTSTATPAANVDDNDSDGDADLDDEQRQERRITKRKYRFLIQSFKDDEVEFRYGIFASQSALWTLKGASAVSLLLFVAIIASFGIQDHPCVSIEGLVLNGIAVMLSVCGIAIAFIPPGRNTVLRRLFSTSATVYGQSDTVNKSSAVEPSTTAGGAAVGAVSMASSSPSQNNGEGGGWIDTVNPRFFMLCPIAFLLVAFTCSIVGTSLSKHAKCFAGIDTAYVPVFGCGALTPLVGVLSWYELLAVLILFVSGPGTGFAWFALGRYNSIMVTVVGGTGLAGLVMYVLEKFLRLQFSEKEMGKLMERRLYELREGREAVLATVVPRHVIPDLFKWFAHDMAPEHAVARSFDRIVVGFIQLCEPIVLNTGRETTPGNAVRQQVGESSTALHGPLPSNSPPPISSSAAVLGASGVHTPVTFVDEEEEAELAEPDDQSWMLRLHAEVDHLIGRHTHISKIKTVGDIVMIAGPFFDNGQEAHTSTVSDTAICSSVADIRGLLSQLQLRAPGFRAGVHVGPVFGACQGSSRLSFDIFGDSVNVASRVMTGQPRGTSAVSHEVRQVLLGSPDDAVRVWAETQLGDAVVRTAKGKGEITTHEIKEL